MWRLVKLLVGALLFLPSTLLFFSTLVFQPVGMSPNEVWMGKAGVLGITAVLALTGIYIIYRVLQRTPEPRDYPVSFVYKTYIEDGSVTYEYRTIFQYALIVPLAIGVVGGVLMQNASVMIAVGGYLIFYAILVSASAYPVRRFISRSAKASVVKVTGSKWSFGQPLRVACYSDGRVQGRHIEKVL